MFKYLFLLLAFVASQAQTQALFAAEKGSVVVSGELSSGMKIESILARYSEGFCGGEIVKSGKVSNKAGKFSASLNFKSEISGVLPACYHTLYSIEMTFSHVRNELGTNYKYFYKKFFTASGSSAVAHQGGLLTCGSINGDQEDVYGRCREQNVPDVLGFAENHWSGLKINLILPTPPNVDESNMALSREVSDWKMSFKIYKNRAGKIGGGSILEVSSKNSQLRSGYYRILGDESYGNESDPKVWGEYLTNTGEKRFFRFSPYGAYNSFYTDCKAGVKAELQITDTRFEYKTRKLFCSYK